MIDIPLSVLIGALVFLIFASSFFSGSETGLMSLNRYRLRHLADQEHKGAKKALRLINQPERMIGLILLGNNFVNFFAAALANAIGYIMFGDVGVLISTVAMTFIVMIFAEVTPKTLAAIHPERFAFPAAHILLPLLKITYPAVWLINRTTHLIFRILGISKESATHSLSSDELRIVVNEASAMIPQEHHQMLLSILDLEKVTVEDIMVPRNEIIGIDLQDDWITLQQQIINSQHTRLPVYEGNIDNLVGIVHVRNMINLFEKEDDQKDTLREIIREAYFVPITTSLNKQLLNFQAEKRRIAFVVNEYGDIQGLVTLEDILEEIVGEFTSDPSASVKDFHQQEDGSYLVDGSSTIRDLNRLLGWQLPTEGPKTLNGLIIEYLEHIPETGTSLLIADHPMEIVQSTKNAIKTVHVTPNWQKPQESVEDQPTG